MTAPIRRLRPLLIGLVVLLFTAGIAFAAKPSGPPAGPAIATEASGQSVPVRVADDEDADKDADDDAREATDETGEAVEDAETETDGGENCATDPSGLTLEALAQLNHGSVVCWAAHQETPDGYDNHGQWVSEWARKNHGHAGQTVEEDLAPAPAGKINGHAGKGNAGNP